LPKTERRKTMSDIIKYAVDIGLGLAFLTKEKIEALAKELSERGDLQKKDVKKYIEDLSKKSEDAKKKVEKSMEKAVKTSLKKMNLVSRDDFVKLEKKVKQLQKALKEARAKEQD
jgi:polyhydroxyalkanoate synthesis regulator phasin